MILFVVNGHNTNPWLGKQGEHSPLILQPCHCLVVSCCIPRPYPGRMQMRLMLCTGLLLGESSDLIVLDAPQWQVHWPKAVLWCASTSLEPQPMALQAFASSWPSCQVHPPAA